MVVSMVLGCMLLTVCTRTDRDVGLRSSKGCIGAMTAPVSERTIGVSSSSRTSKPKSLANEGKGAYIPVTLTIRVEFQPANQVQHVDRQSPVEQRVPRSVPIVAQTLVAAGVTRIGPMCLQGLGKKGCLVEKFIQSLA